MSPLAYDGDNDGNAPSVGSVVLVVRFRFVLVRFGDRSVSSRKPRALIFDSLFLGSDTDIRLVSLRRSSSKRADGPLVGTSDPSAETSFVVSCGIGKRSLY
jgi:hypothetical protein